MVWALQATSVWTVSGPSRTGDSQPQERERIVETATRLFASLGYDATPLHTIADAAGIDGDAMADLVGDKHDIYLKVMERAFLALKAGQDAAFAEFTHDQAGVRRLADRHLDFCVTHPEVPELWIHRWLGDAADVAGMEARYLRPLLDRVTDELRDLVAPNVGLDEALWSLIWCVRGFVVGGVLAPDGQMRGPHDAQALRRFRTHLHLLVDLMFAPGAPR
ncbi:TetR/AcrR family transcriptional regulator [Nonomuraea sp. MG754425]|nr:TetR/AcrR family transcriptional regulator [Nonomuraea sp. MG754425]